MTKRDRSFKNKMLIPLIITFIVTTLIISWNFYRSLESSVIASTNEKLDIFTDKILSQALHLDLILETTTEALARNHLAIALAVARTLDQEGVDTLSAALTQLSEMLGINEFSVADRYGIIIYSNIENYIGFYYGSTAQTAIYMPLTDGTITELQEAPRRSVLADQTLGDILHYTGVARAGGGFIQLGFNADIILRLQEEINIERTINETTLGNNGYGFVLREGIVIAHPNRYISGRDVSGEDWFSLVTAGDGLAWLYIDGSRYYAGFKSAGGHTVIGLIPESDYYADLNQALISSMLIFAGALAVLILVVSLLINFLLKAERLARETEMAMQRLTVENAALDGLSRMKSEYLKSLSHNTKTPLTEISVNVQLAANLFDAIGAVGSEDRKIISEALREAQEDVLKVARMSGNALWLASIQDSQKDLKPLDMSDFLPKCAETFRSLIETQGNTLTVSVPSSLPHVSASADQLVQVIMNLLTNANTHTAKGSISLEATADNESVIIKVEDTGSGIKTEMLPRIFERGVADTDSAGLGLPICKYVIESHGGTIFVENQRGAGTAVTITLPGYREDNSKG